MKNSKPSRRTVLKAAGAAIAAAVVASKAAPAQSPKPVGKQAANRPVPVKKR